MDNERRSEILNKCLSYISDAAPSNKDLYITLSKGIGLSDKEIKELDMEYCLPGYEEDEDDDTRFGVSEYIDFQGHDTRTGEDFDANNRAWEESREYEEDKDEDDTIEYAFIENFR